MRYNWQQPDWPHFQYDLSGLQDLLVTFSARMGSAAGSLKALPDSDRTDVLLNLMVSEAIKTPEIEGEYFSRADFMSSIRNNLGLNTSPESVTNIAARGVADLTVNARDTFEAPLSTALLFAWHEMLLGHHDGLHKLKIGGWRTHAEPMQVVSGSPANQQVHFEAPLSKNVPAEMKQFVLWFNNTAPGGKKEIRIAPVRAAVTHLYFESIHPFEDGNGRIGRTLAEKALAQTLRFAPVLSLSSAIESTRDNYYAALQRGQSSNEITAWISWFLHSLMDAQSTAETEIDFTIRKASFFEQYMSEMNDRQVTVVRRMLQEGQTGFEGGMSTKKYCIIADTSKATASRDLEHLTRLGAFRKYGGGRSTRYDLTLLQTAGHKRIGGLT